MLYIYIYTYMSMYVCANVYNSFNSFWHGQILLVKGEIVDWQCNLQTTFWETAF